MSRQSNAAPTIIKRKKVIRAAGHHGGAWKVAYADFVTAMMAFFLMLWLLGATTEEQRRGLPTISPPRRRCATCRAVAIRCSATRTCATAAPRNAIRRGRRRQRRRASRRSRRENDSFEEILERLEGMGAESLLMSEALRHIVTRITDEGLIVELFDLPGAPLFAEDGDAPEAGDRCCWSRSSPRSSAWSPTRSRSRGTPAPTPSCRPTTRAGGLSTARAERLRLMFEAAGFDPQRVARVAGHADRRPAHQSRWRCATTGWN
jgi:chemotaxis protein MotB